MKTIIHTSASRGYANHGWLKSHHTFSFANYYHPERMNFGVLRVLNDDQVAGNGGFPPHPHQNMEIISIPLSGDLQHEDNMGNSTVIKEGDVQIMSAGTGVIHSEFNANEDEDVKFLQIWVIPNQQNVTPRYDQITLADLKKENALYQILSPNAGDEGVWIHQDAWFHLGEYTEDKEEEYQLKKSGNGVYLFVLEGSVKQNDTLLQRRDGMAIWETEKFKLNIKKGTKLLLMEVPMN